MADPTADPTPNADPARAPDPAAAPDPTNTTLGGADPTAQPDPTPVDPAPAPAWSDRVKAFGDEKVRNFATRFASEADLAKWALDQREKNSTAISVPGPDAPPEEVAEFRKKLGVPETPDGYEIPLPEGVELDDAGKGRLDAFKAAMHAKGATPDVVAAAFETYQGMVDAELSARKEAIETARAAQRREWGGDYDRNVELAKRAARTFGDSALATMFDTESHDGKPLGEHPAILAAFAKIGKRMGEGGMIGPVDANEAASTEARRKELQSLQTTNPEKYRSREVQDELDRIYGMQVGNAPIVGAGGRVA